MMKEAEVNGKLVVAGPDSADASICPDCGSDVQKRRITRMDGTVTHSYRHKCGQGKYCPRRYRPT